MKKTLKITLFTVLALLISLSGLYAQEQTEPGETPASKQDIEQANRKTNEKLDKLNKKLSAVDEAIKTAADEKKAAEEHQKKAEEEKLKAENDAKAAKQKENEQFRDRLTKIGYGVGIVVLAALVLIIRSVSRAKRIVWSKSEPLSDEAIRKMCSERKQNYLEFFYQHPSGAEFKCTARFADNDVKNGEMHFFLAGETDSSKYVKRDGLLRRVERKIAEKNGTLKSA